MVKMLSLFNNNFIIQFICLHSIDWISMDYLSRAFWLLNTQTPYFLFSKLSNRHCTLIFKMADVTVAHTVCWYKFTTASMPCARIILPAMLKIIITATSLQY